MRYRTCVRRFIEALLIRLDHMVDNPIVGRKGPRDNQCFQEVIIAAL